MTIDLGFAWTDLPSGETLAFVDVPGHERFVPNMLAGVGPVPAAMIVVAADGGWMPQSAEHLAALHALGVRHGLLVVTRADLADPAPARAAALARIAAHLPRRGRGGRGQRAHRRRACRTCGPRWTGWSPGCPRRTRARRCGCGSTARSPSPAAAPSSPARSAPARSRAGDTLALGDGAVRVRGLQSLGAASRPGARPWPGSRSTCAACPRTRYGRGDALLTPGRVRGTRDRSTCGSTAIRSPTCPPS